MRLAAPGLARLTADADGLAVHHCLANRRDLHAEYPPGTAAAAGDAAASSQVAAANSQDVLQRDSLQAAAAGSQVAEPDPAEQPMSRADKDDDGLAGDVGVLDAAAGTTRGCLRFPWECGPLLEALLHAPVSAHAQDEPAAPLAVHIEDLPTPEAGCNSRTQDVLDALLREGVLVAV